MRAFLLAFGATGLLAAAAAIARADEPADAATVESLHREVAQLRQIVQELRERLEKVEYDRLPRISSQPSEPVVAPVQRNGKLRFPIEIERGTFPPPWRVLAPKR